MKGLIERLETAVAGSAELDAEIGAWLEANADDDHGPGSNYHLSKQKTWMGVKGWEWRRWTTSIDAALTLVPEGWTAWEVGSRVGRTRFRAEVSRLPENLIEDAVIGHARTPALALCIAALMARSQS